MKSSKSGFFSLAVRIAVTLSPVVMATVLLVSDSQPVRAVVTMNPNPQGNIPTSVYNYLRNSDAPGHNNPTIVHWIAPQGSPAATSMNVAYGRTAPLNLRLHFAGTISKLPNTALRVRTRVIDKSGTWAPNISGIVGEEMQLEWSPNQKGTFKQQNVAFTLSPPSGGFKKPGTYNIGLYTKAIQQFSGAPNFRCVHGAGGPSTTSLTAFGPCPQTGWVFPFQINITGNYNNQASLTTVANSPPASGKVQRGQTYTLRARVNNSGPAGAYGTHVMRVWNRNSGYVSNVNPLGDLTPAANRADIFGVQKDYSTNDTNCRPNMASAENCWAWVFEQLEVGATVQANFQFRIANTAPLGNGTNNVCFRPFVVRQSPDSRVHTGSDLCYEVIAPAQPLPSCTINASPSILSDSQPTANLTWSSSNANNVSIEGIGNNLPLNRPASSPYPVSPTTTTTYIMTVTNSAGATDECQTTVTVPKNHPFLRSTGADVYAGAVLAGGQQSCSTAYEHYGERAATARIETLGRYGYGNSTDSINTTLMGFSSTQYAALASGWIANTAQEHYAGNNGFARAATDQPWVKDLLLANSSGGQQSPGSDVYYGNFYGDPDLAAAFLPCADYGTITSQAHTYNGSLADVFISNTRPVTRRTSAWTINSGSVPTDSQWAGKARTIVVDGGVHITGNITFPDTYTNPDDIPYLMIIARGPITIAPGVSRIDAHLVALPSANPSANSNDGIIDTCQNSSTPNWPNSMTVSSCRTKLAVNGSLSAQKIYWKRTYGTLLDSNSVLAGESASGCVFRTGAPSTSASAEAISFWLQTRSRLCSAEFINLSPELYLGRPSDERVGTDSPPIGTIELPPIL